MLLLGGAVSTPVLVGSLLSRGGQAGRAPPFDTAHPALVGDSSEVVLYVSDGCRWCVLELGAWAGTVARKGGRTPLVVLSPDSDPNRSPPRVPEALRARTAHDPDGSMARALGVRAVPFTARVEPGGRVVGVHLGLSGAEIRRELMRFLNHPPTRDRQRP